MPARRLMRAVLAVLAAAAVFGCGAATAQQTVSIPTSDLSRGPGLMLKGFWFAAPVAGPAPAVVLLHGCGGPYNRLGALSERMRDYAALLNKAGVHALVVDSFTSRGEKQICTQDRKVRSRLITQANRRLDALSSLEWLAARPDVDASRLGLLGWSHGGSTVLAATNERVDEVVNARVKPEFAVAFYPGCKSALERGYETHTRLLLLLGEADDWTPAATCRQLVRRTPGRKPAVESYAGAFHGFDSRTKVHVRTDVPGGARHGKGITVGGNAQALKRSRARLLAFIAAAPATPATALSTSE